MVAIAVLAMVLALNVPGQARGMGGHVPHGFDGHHEFDRGPHGRFLIGPAFPYYGYSPYYPPTYAYPAPGSWYYCPTYRAYYPSVTSCPETWVPVG